MRPFVSNDRDSLITTIDAVCAEGRWMSRLHFQPTSAWQHALETPVCLRHSLLIVEDESKVVGWCRLWPSACIAQAPEVELGVGLLPAYRNRGLGTALICQILAWARLTGLRRVVLTSRGDNTRALHVFRQCGFQTLNTSNGQIEMAYQII
jgi:RimJ/RimL family protein N-acetyltransferase